MTTSDRRYRRAVATLLAGAALLTGCGSTEPAADVTPAVGGAAAASGCPATGGPIAIAMSGRANSPAPVLPPIAEQIVDVAVGGVEIGGVGPIVTLIGIDGQPESLGSAAFEPTGENDIALEGNRTEFLDSFRAAATSLRATTAEVDALAALDAAGRAAGDADTPGTVVFADSGLQTVAPLNFREPGMLDADPAEVVEFLDRTGAIPNLTGRIVFLVGIGDTAAPQAPLDVARRERVAVLWEQIAQAGGAACVDVIATPRGGDAPPDVPPVSLVSVPPPPVLDPSALGPAVLPDDQTVGFVGGRAELRNPEAAAVVLQPLADALRAQPDRRIRLTGTTARHGDLAGQIDLAERRAEAIKAVLVGLGASPDQIQTRGLGSEFPEYLDDQGPGGALLPGPAAANRSVRIEPV